MFQPFDGVQTVCTGALRGLGDTRAPVLVNLIGHWLIGLPAGYLLCFRRGWGVTGLWTGLAVGTDGRRRRAVGRLESAGLRMSPSGDS